MKISSEQDYWSNFYESGVAPETPSQFATHIADKYAGHGQSLVELGCGNGRDARFFASKGLAVTAIDLCAPEIEEDKQNNPAPSLLNYKAADFTRLPSASEPYEIIYSRFTLHSVDYEGQSRTLQWAYHNLGKAGLLCIETRGQKNEIYKLGDTVDGEEDSFIYNGHYRRFVDFGMFTEDIKSTGFAIVEAVESTGFAPFEGTDYHFIRVIAQKQ